MDKTREPHPCLPALLAILFTVLQIYGLSLLPHIGQVFRDATPTTTTKMAAKPRPKPADAPGFRETRHRTSTQT